MKKTYLSQYLKCGRCSIHDSYYGDYVVLLPSLKLPNVSALRESLVLTLGSTRIVTSFMLSNRFSIVSYVVFVFSTKNIGLTYTM